MSIKASANLEGVLNSLKKKNKSDWQRENRIKPL